MMFGRRNAWDSGPPGPGGGGGGGGRFSGTVRDARDAARELMFRRKKKEESRSMYHENIKRDVVKEKNYMVFHIKEGEDQISSDVLGKTLDDLGLKPEQVISINGNPFNDKEIEVLMSDDVSFDVAAWNKKLEETEATLTVNKLGKLEEVLIVRNLPLTLDIEAMKEWIKEAIGPFVSRINDVIPLKIPQNKLREMNDTAKKFFEGKYDGSWRVSVTPKGHAEVPNFAVFGPENLQGVVRYTKRGNPVSDLCWSCYNPGHKKNDKHENGNFVCPGPKEWNEYVKEFRNSASIISGKTEADLFHFNVESPEVLRLEKELADIAEKLEQVSKEKDLEILQVKKVADEDRAHQEKKKKEEIDKLQEVYFLEWQNKYGKLETEMDAKTKQLEASKEEKSRLQEEVKFLSEKLSADVSVPFSTIETGKEKQVHYTTPPPPPSPRKQNRSMSEERTLKSALKSGSHSSHPSSLPYQDPFKTPTSSNPPPRVPPKIVPTLRAGNIVRIVTDDGLIEARIFERQVKRDSKDYHKFQHHYNLDILKGDKKYKAGSRVGFNLTNPNTWELVGTTDASMSV